MAKAQTRRGTGFYSAQQEGSAVLTGDVYWPCRDDLQGVGQGNENDGRKGQIKRVNGKRKNNLEE